MDGIGYISVSIPVDLSERPIRLCDFKNGILRANLSLPDQIFKDVYVNNINLTGNITANEGFLKLNWSWLQNVPNYAYNSSLLNYYLNSNPSNFLNQTQTDLLYVGDSELFDATFNASINNLASFIAYSWLEINPFNFYNASNFNPLIYVLTADLVSLLGNWSSDKSNYWNETLLLNGTLARYQFENNNFNGSGNFTTLGHINSTSGFFDKLTNIGELIMDGVITSKDIIPVTTNLYSLGNSTNWFNELFTKNIYSENINTSTLNSENITSGNLDSDTVEIQDNLTIAGYDINEKDGNLVITLK